MDRLIFAIELGAAPVAAQAPPAPLTAAGWLDLVAQAERARVDFVTIADHHRPDRAHPRGDDPRGDDPRGMVSGRLDAIMVACRVAPATRHVGIVPMASTTLTEPFLLSTQIATLDYVSRGRAGWQLDVSGSPGDALYVGPRPMPEVPARYREAAEHAEVVRRLWDSWDDDAEIRDVEHQRFIDRDRIHHVDFAGEHFSIRGPSITPRPPQGQPVIITAVDRDEMVPLAASVADVAILAGADPVQLEADADAVRRAARGTPARQAEIRVLADVDVALGGDPLRAPTGRRTLTLTGDAGDAAQQLEAWAERGLDGFRLRPVHPTEDLAGIAGPLSGKLQRHGVLRTTYDEPTLRGLLGLPRPASLFVTA
jgi:alkanesulfonate monooxygenase SsuD/methylene tetrahydromethanopterin reductase-like flavin-dependent oxidoreductase (luciferase family)